MAEFPCKECKDRYVGCHSSCEQYIEMKNKMKQVHRQEQRQRDVDYYSKRNARYTWR